ncbi:MAG: helix-turn-helix domain-containing protein, partial [Rhodospirillaceae bacterium]|nr:helix-turn-helix domain-containing protein [Rhodospirillaceae bacterium]
MSAGPASTHRIGAETVLFAEGDPATHLFAVIKGVLRLCRLLADGRRSITGFAYPGDVIGIAVSNSYAYSAETVTECELRRMPRSAVTHLLESSPELARHMYALVSNELLAAQDQMLLLGRKTAPERVASFLLRLAERGRPGGGEARRVSLPMSRADIADYLGLTPETVCRVLTRMRQCGVIKLTNAQTVDLLDVEALRRLAEDAETVVRRALIHM